MSEHQVKRDMEAHAGVAAWTAAQQHGMLLMGAMSNQTMGLCYRAAHLINACSRGTVRAPELGPDGLCS